MITNAIFYRLPDADCLESLAHEAGLAPFAFVPCGPTQEKSLGFVPPRGEAYGELVEALDGQFVMKLLTEKKSVPASVIARAVDERIQKLLQSTGRKPGKKETRDMRDDARQALLPEAFPTQSATLIWIDHTVGLMVIGAPSQAKADEAVTFLVQAVPGLACTLLNTLTSPVAAMADWLNSGEAPAGFSVDRDCELKAADESRACIRYSRCSLDIDEVRQHIKSGKLPTRLALTWSDRVSFVLTDSLQLKKIEFLDVVFEEGSKSAADHFDADVAIMTGEMRKLIPDLIAALGGEIGI